MPEAAPTPVRAWLGWFLVPLVAAAVLDQISKTLVHDWWEAGVALPAWIQWAQNPGVAFSLLHSRPGLVTLLTAVLIPLLAVVWWRGPRREGRVPNLAFGLILGGAIGNGIDRGLAMAGRLQGVRDFIHVDLGVWPLDPWPTFNIADSAICIGFALLLLTAFRKPASARATAGAAS